MNIISNWIKKRREKKEAEERMFDEYLMKEGYLCPDYKLHEDTLLDWEGDVRYMVCKNCGRKVAAMAISRPGI